MPFQFQSLGFAHPDLDAAGSVLRQRIREHFETRVPWYRRLWNYYRNPILPPLPAADDDTSARPYRQPQEWGLPSRITGVRPINGTELLRRIDQVQRKEVVIENDIAWRIDVQVDFLFGKPILLRSAAATESRRAAIEHLLREVFAHNGGIGFLQKLATLGAVHGHVDVLVKLVSPASTAVDLSPTSDAPMQDTADAALLGEHATATTTPAGRRFDVERLASSIRFEIVEPGRSLPLLSDFDPSVAVGYGQVYTLPRPAPTPLPRRLWPWSRPVDAPGPDPAGILVVELLTPDRWQRYQDEQLIGEGPIAIGRLPLVHIQNTVVPFEYAGGSDVEPLLALQDELNTRLCDRAHRITMQSFKMYLGKGIDDFMNLPVAPGRMWTTDNMGAQVIELGGDAAAPSEDRHIDEVREALDKTSGVSPIAAGAVKGRIGRLTSAAALRVTMQALLARTERKRTTYGPAIAQLCELALAWLDVAGLFRTSPPDRRVEIDWPDPIPVGESERLDEARRQTQLGFDHAQGRREPGD